MLLKMSINGNVIFHDYEEKTFRWLGLDPSISGILKNWGANGKPLAIQVLSAAIYYQNVMILQATFTIQF